MMVIGRVPGVCLGQPPLVNAVEVVVVVVVDVAPHPPVEEADVPAHTGGSPGLVITQPGLLVTAEVVTLARDQLLSGGDR